VRRFTAVRNAHNAHFPRPSGIISSAKFAGWDMTTFLWLTKEQWDVANAVATCIGAFATSGAVIVSLWLARQPDRVQLRAIAQDLVLITQAQPNTPHYAVITVTNIGRRPAKVTNLGWEIGRGKSKKSFIQTTGADRLSSALPVILDDGAEARWFFPLDEWLTDWPEHLGADWQQLLPKMRLCVYTSTWKPIKTPMDKTLIEKIADRCRVHAGEQAAKAEAT
jgi:hypothetical protein